MAARVTVIATPNNIRNPNHKHIISNAPFVALDHHPLGTHQQSQQPSKIPSRKHYNQHKHKHSPSNKRITSGAHCMLLFCALHSLTSNTFVHCKNLRPTFVHPLSSTLLLPCSRRASTSPFGTAASFATRGFNNHQKQNSFRTTLNAVEMEFNNRSVQTMSSQPTTPAAPKAKRIPATFPSLRSANTRLRSGQLVSLPTETVYGMGCHTIDPEGIRRVFAAKEHPFTDPLIVHVNTVQHALALWDAF